MSDTAKRDAVLHVLREVVHGDPCHRQFMPLLDEIDRLRDENAALRSAIERVRALHDVRERRHIGWVDVTCCSECSDDDNAYVYPCPTLRALEETP